MIYYALYTGDGEGCEDTIGCNMTFDRLKATTLEEAKIEAINNAPNGVAESCDVVYTDKIMVLAVAEQHDLAPQIAAERAADRERCVAAERATKLAQFEKLKRELGQ